MQESALVIEVPDAQSLVDPWRQVHDPVAARGVPAHITLLYPFAPAERLDDTILATLATTLDTVCAFEYQLTSVAQFPGVIYLRPEPEERFRALTRQLAAAFPDYPPYGGKFPEPQPHVTVAFVSDHRAQGELLDRIHADLDPQLPLRCRAGDLSVFTPHDDGAWRRAHRFALRD